MKKFFTLILLTLAALQLSAVAPESGKIYKIVNPHRGNLKLAEDIIGHTVYCPTDLGGKVYQYWILEQGNDNTWTIKNAYTGRYLQNETRLYQAFPTSATTAGKFTISANNSVGNDYYSILNANGHNGLHCDAASALVPYGPDSDSPGGSSWKFELVQISDEELAAARTEYEAFSKVTEKTEEVTATYHTFFGDDLCMQLKPEYSSMSDQELQAAMSTLPAELIQAALKVKNNSWAAREKEFRVHTYEAYCDPDIWGTKLLTKKFTWQNNPTGIYANTANILYVFVGSDTPAGATLEIDAVTDNGSRGTRTTIKKGLNIIPVSRDYQTIFVIYTANTADGKPLSDFPDIDIRIEGGVLNGYWDIERHNDSDWVEISQNLATHPYILIKGKNFIFNMVREFMTKPGYCNNKITDAIGWWDNMAEWQWGIMGLEEYRPTYFNNKLCARTLPTGYQSATHYYTQYLGSYINNLLPYEQMMSNADNCWGPAHENGHVHQEAITPVNCSEVSNNLFSNLTLYKLGRYTSRGGAISEIADEYTQNLSWPSRANHLMLRMYWQLYLYYHVAGNNPDFYPTLFKLLREEPIVKVGNAPTYGDKDLLHFALKCCEAAGEDLTHFFEAWGFFVPMDNSHYGDYADYYLTSTQKMIDDTKAKMAQYPKRAGAIQFIEDRVQGIPRTDGGKGNKQHHANSVTNAGEVGHYTDFTPEKMNVKATGYIYTKGSVAVTISSGTGAVGFKVLDEDGNMLTFANTHKIQLLPQQLTKNIKVVAVQANGEYVEVLPAALAGTEEEQLAALNAALSAANTCFGYTNSSGKLLGYYYSEAIAPLKELHAKAQAAKDNADQSEHTYGEWAMLLDSAISQLKNDRYAIVNIKEKNIHTFTNRTYSSYGFTYEGGLLVGASRTNIPADDERRMWEFEKAGAPDNFYIKCGNGYYITTIEDDEQATATTKLQKSALVFVAHNNNDGTFSFNLKESPEIYLAMKKDGSEYKVIGGAGGEQNTKWRITISEENAKAHEAATLAALTSEATRVIDEIGSADGENVTINENIANHAENLATLLAELNSANNEAVENKETAIDLARYIDKLSEALANIDGKYILTPAEGEMYYIKDIEADKFCGIETESTNANYKTSVSLTELAKDDKNQWWKLEATGNQGEYKIYNVGQEKYLYSNTRGYIKADGAQEADVYTVTLDKENNALLIADGSKFWYNGLNNYASISRSSSPWRIVKIGAEQTGIEQITTEQQAGDGAIYDLYGRKIETITNSGIYIVNGKKVLVK